MTVTLSRTSCPSETDKKWWGIVGETVKRLRGTLKEQQELPSTGCVVYLTTMSNIFDMCQLWRSLAWQKPLVKNIKKHLNTFKYCKDAFEDLQKLSRKSVERFLKQKQQNTTLHKKDLLGKIEIGTAPNTIKIGIKPSDLC